MHDRPKRKRRTEKRPLNLVDTEAVSIEYKKDRLQEIKKLEVDAIGCVYKLFFQARKSTWEDNNHLIGAQSKEM